MTADRYMSIQQICRHASISDRTLRHYLSEIPHSRATPRGKIRIRWSDFVGWMKSRQVEIKRDDIVMDILREMHNSRVS